jgi:hypothetical protein
MAAMRQTLSVWNPLYDRLVALWSATVDGELPCLGEDGTVGGGWPARQWSADWPAERSRWIADYEEAAREHEPTGRHAHPKSNLGRLRGALLACAGGGDALSGREVGWARRALANTLTRHGAPGSPRRDAIRAVQAGVAATPDHAALARVLARRLDQYPAGAGLASLGPASGAVSDQDAPVEGIPLGTPVPDHLLQKAARALEAPVDELIRRGVITSGDVLAAVLPQLTSRLIAAGIDDPALAGLYGHAYTAFPAAGACCCSTSSTSRR